MSFLLCCETKASNHVYDMQDAFFFRKCSQNKIPISSLPPSKKSQISYIHFLMHFKIFFSLAGQRFIKVAKSPISSPLAFPFHITSSGISLLSDEGMELMGPEINSIHCQGSFLTLACCESADHSECIIKTTNGMDLVVEHLQSKPLF